MNKRQFEKIYFVVQAPPTKRDYERFGFDLLQKRGFKTVFLDVTYFINPKYQRESTGDWIDSSFHQRINNRKQWIGFLQSIDVENVLFVDNVGFHRASLDLFLFMEKFRIHYAALWVNNIPQPRYPLKNILFKKDVFVSIFQAVRKRLVQRKLKDYHPTYIMAGGRADVERFSKGINGSKLIWAHAFDYDRYLTFMAQKLDSILKDSYLVFLDEGYPTHPDFSLKGMMKNPFLSVQHYADSMESFFSVIEERCDLKIVIAAHPKSAYEMIPGLFKGRKIIKGKTLELVAHSKGVLGHSSTSINFAVLFKKPVAFLLPQEIQGSYHAKMIEAFAAALSQVPYTLDRIKDFNPESYQVIDDQSYDNFLKQYIKAGDFSEKMFWDIFADTVLGGQKG
jgi:hypothetical protein